MALDTRKFERLLQNDNEKIANGLLNIVRQNLAMYDAGKDKAKFLEDKKKQILDLLRQYDEAALTMFHNELFKINSRHMRDQAEKDAAEENRAFSHKVRKSFDREDSHNAIRSKNLGISDA